MSAFGGAVWTQRGGDFLGGGPPPGRDFWGISVFFFLGGAARGQDTPIHTLVGWNGDRLSEPLEIFPARLTGPMRLRSHPIRVLSRAGSAHGVVNADCLMVGTRKKTGSPKRMPSRACADCREG